MSVRVSFAAALLLLAAIPLVAPAQDPKTTLKPVNVVGSGPRLMVLVSEDGVSVPVLIPAEFEGRATITVENWRTEEVTLVAEDNGRSVTIGKIPANSRITVAVPEPLVKNRATVQLMVDPGGVKRFLSSPRRIAANEHLALRVPAR